MAGQNLEARPKLIQTMKAIISGGTAILILAAGIFAFIILNEDETRSDGTGPQADAEQEQQTVQTELADPGTVPEEELAEEMPEGYTVDEDGFVWEPLSYDKPQIKNNGDGTVTMKKLARVYEADGSMREMPITARATPDQRRLPIQSREVPTKTKKDEEDEEDQEDG